MTSDIPNVSLDNSAMTACAILHCMHVNESTLTTAVEQARDQIASIQASQPSWTGAPVQTDDVVCNDPSKRETFLVFALLHLVYVFASEAPATLSNCTTNRTTCTLRSDCQFCHPTNAAIASWKTTKLPASTATVLYRIFSAWRNGGRSDDEQLHRKGDEARWEVRTEAVMMATNSSGRYQTTVFTRALQDWVKRKWCDTISRNFLLLGNHLRSFRQADVVQRQPYREQSYDDVCPPASPSYSPPLTPRADEGGDSPIYSPASPSYMPNAMSDAQEMHNVDYPNDKFARMMRRALPDLRSVPV
jgi:hypothetical protein